MFGFGLFGMMILAISALCLGNGTLILDGATFVMALFAAPCVLIATTWLDEKLGGKNKGFIAVGVACALLFFAGCAMRETPTETTRDGVQLEDPRETDDDSFAVDSVSGANSDRPSDRTQKAPQLSQEPEYADSRWPTHASELLAIPEENRYYNAWNHVWTTCTVAGPVVNVYQAKDEPGAPIFISIGDYYPSSDCVTLVVWADAYYDFERMINAVDDGGAWLSVTGYLSEYNGNLQFDISDGYVEYTWWEDVR